MSTEKIAGEVAGPGRVKSPKVRTEEKAMSVSLGAGIVQLVIKLAAFAITGSAAVFADAAESTVHLIAVLFAFFSLRIASKPADKEHPYGHAKIGFFSAGVEGGVILVAAIFIIGDATHRLLSGPEVQSVGWGISFTALTVVLNGILGAWLIRLGRRQNQLILVANGWHVLTDAWTSVGVIVGLSLVWLTGWASWDPICAIVVAVNILVTGSALVRRGVSGLMDAADDQDLARAEALLDKELDASGVSYHALRMRNLGDSIAIDLHLLFDDSLSIREAHAFATALEAKLSEAFTPHAVVMTHLEPRLDHARLHGEVPSISQPNSTL